MVDGRASFANPPSAKLPGRGRERSGALGSIDPMRDSVGDSVNSVGMAEPTAAQKIEIIRQILAEPMPKWFQNDRRRANSYAKQIQRIAEVIDR